MISQSYDRKNISAILRYHNVFYPLENIKIRITLKSVLYNEQNSQTPKPDFSNGDCTVLASSSKNNYIATKQGYGYAIIKTWDERALQSQSPEKRGTQNLAGLMQNKVSLTKDSEDVGYNDAIYFHFIDFKRKINGLYFLYDHKNQKILGMKTDNSTQLTKLLRFSGNSDPGRTIRAGYGYGGFHNHLILNKERKNLYCFNPFKTVLFPLQPEDRNNPNDEIVDFLTLPYMQTVSMSRNGMICLHSYEKTDPNSPKVECTIKLDLSLGEDCYSIAVCPLF